MQVKIGDVARTAGVSTATVSRALRGLPHVSPDTRDLVVRVATEMGYVASKSASSLATGRTHTVGLVTPHVGRWFFAQVIEAVEHELRYHGYDVLLLALPPHVDDSRPVFDPGVLRRRVDAVIVLTVPLTGRELDLLRKLQMPLLFVGASIAGAMSVRVDDVAIGRAATRHLISLGHRRIAHLGGDPSEPLNFSAPADRRAGWLSELRNAGVTPCRELDVSADFSAVGGAAATRQLLALPEPPTAVFAASDEMAIGALLAAHEAGLRVPEELSVLGVDDHELAELFGLTTVAQPVREQGRQAADLVLRALSGDSSHLHDHVLVDTQIVMRSTTGPARFSPGVAM